MKIYKISAVTLIIENMRRSCRFYSQIPGFKLVYGGSSDDTFTTFEIEEELDYILPLLQTRVNP
jgi:catechol 2,3-dioxygenase-like lactoylglutathione lyase family enzyme